jgi:hypothetical protein
MRPSGSPHETQRLESSLIIVSHTRSGGEDEESLASLSQRLPLVGFDELWCTRKAAQVGVLRAERSARSSETSAIRYAKCLVGDLSTGNS